MGKRPKVLAVAVLWLLSAAPLFAQTVVNPRTVEFDPSADHNALGADGQQMVLLYQLAIYPVGVGQVLYTVDLGKPAPDVDGKIRVDFAARLPIWPLANGTYEAYVAAVGSSGSSQSDQSNQFVFQSCSFSVAPTRQSVGAAGGTISVSVTGDLGCGWTAASNAGWIAVSPPGGDGAGSLSLAVERNSGTTLRTGTVTIAGQTVTVFQDTDACLYGLSSSGQAMGVSGGSGTVGLSTGAGCVWSAISSSSWVTVSPSGGTGSGSLSFTVGPNGSPNVRLATLTIGGQAFTISQPGLVCDFTVSGTSRSVDASGGSGSVGLTAPAGCSWVTASGASWLTVSPASGSGSSSVSFVAAANTATVGRTGTLMVAGQTVTVTQAAAACSFGLGTTSLRFGQNGGTSPVSVTTPGGCTWTAASNATWLTVTPSTGRGPGTVSITASSNGLTSSRTGTATIAGITVTVVENAKGTPKKK